MAVLTILLSLTVMISAFDNIVLLSYNYEFHGLEPLKSFPSSNDLYPAIEPSFLERAGLRSLYYTNTCNRSEFILEFPDKQAATLNRAIEVISELSSQTGNWAIEQQPVFLKGSNALRHLLQVSCGLRSLAVGEHQITGQIRRDAEFAERGQLLNGILHRVIQKALATQKIIRNETDLKSGSESIMSLLNTELQHMPGFYGYQRVAISGTGDMSNKALQFAIEQGLQEVFIIRRDITLPLPEFFQKTIERHPSLKCVFMQWEDFLNSKSHNLNLLICAAGTNAAPVTESHIEQLYFNKILSPQAPIVDLGVPANIESMAEEKVLRLGHLIKYAAENSDLRKHYFEQARPIIEKAIYALWLDIIYADNQEVVNKFLFKSNMDQQSELCNLFDGSFAEISAKKRRILEDFMRKFEKRTLRIHKELLLEILSQDSKEAEKQFIEKDPASSY